MAGFRTASGKCVHVSDRALEEAKKKLNEEESVEEQQQHHDARMADGFQTASGKRVYVSDSAVEDAKKRLKEEKSAEDHEQHAGMALAGGFRTASGNRIHFNESALEEARKRLNEEEKSVEEHRNNKITPKMARFQTASANSIHVVKDCALVKDDQKRLKEEERSVDEDQQRDMLARMVGFRTASGNRVHISNDALVKAQKELNGDQLVEPVRTNQKQCSDVASEVGNSSRHLVPLHSLRLPSASDSLDEVDVVGFIVSFRINHNEEIIYLADEELNFSAVRLQGTVEGLELDSTLRVGRCVAVLDAGRRPMAPSARLPYLFRSEFTLFSSNPSMKSLSSALSQLETKIKKEPNYLWQARRRLQELLGFPESPRTPAIGLEGGRTCKSPTL